ncbi:MULTISPECIES: hypothetical protein [Bradyrhizobium]|uniref:hypothetical protein n=1 Tax=Bradyrhizobium TaxID=374 RepID=UPI0004884194|nr:MULTISPECIES: hypothetical protein [Bradyrhizobium]UFW51226.1 hypothetical protein BaraCB756_09500 [Bradyrhizobium arachidis]
MADETTLYRLFSQLPELEKQELMRAAGVSDTRPSVLKKDGYGSVPEGEAWVQNNRSNLAPLILRWIDPSDDDVAALVNQGDLKVGHAVSEGVATAFKVRFSSPSPTDENGIPLGELAADAVALSQLMIVLMAANRPFGVSTVMPHAQVSAGSVSFALAGPGLLGFGLMVVAACGAGIISAPVLLPVYAGGGILAAAGAIETVLNWRRTVAETKKVGQETQKIEKERSLLDLESLKRELEIQKLRLEVRAAEPPASSLVPLDQVKHAAHEANVPLGYALHILNRTLPTFFVLQGRMPERAITIEGPLGPPRH